MLTFSPRYESDRRQVVLGPLVAERHAAADPLLVPIEVAAIEERAAQAEADGRIPQVRLLEADQVALHLGAGRGFDAEPLAGAAQGPAAGEVVPTGGQAGPVEVLLVEQDLAHEAGVGVDGDADHQPAGLRFVELDVDVDEPIGIERRERIGSGLGKQLRIAELRVDRRDVRIGRQRLPGSELRRRAVFGGAAYCGAGIVSTGGGGRVLLRCSHRRRAEWRGCGRCLDGHHLRRCGGRGGRQLWLGDRGLTDSVWVAAGRSGVGTGSADRLAAVDGRAVSVGGGRHGLRRRGHCRRGCRRLIRALRADDEGAGKGWRAG